MFIIAGGVPSFESKVIQKTYLLRKRSKGKTYAEIRSYRLVTRIALKSPAQARLGASDAPKTFIY